MCFSHSVFTISDEKVGKKTTDGERRDRRRLLWRAEAAGKEKLITEQKLLEIASGRGGKKERKEIWMKGISCVPSQVASQIAALSEATGDSGLKTLEQKQQNQWFLSVF